MAVVKVPKTPKRAFNKNRPPSALLLDQIRHLEWAALPAAQRTPRQLPKGRVRTEEQAAERIELLTQMVLEEQAERFAKRAPPGGAPREFKRVVLPPVPRLAPARTRKKKKKATKKTATRKASAATRRKRSSTSGSARRRTRARGKRR